MKTICSCREYGEHISLICVNHPNRSWSTKNIAPIGARTIFYHNWLDPNMELECRCPIEQLRHKCDDAI